MKGTNETRTEDVKVEENEFFTGAGTEAGTMCTEAEGIESSQVNVARRESARTDAVRSGAAQTDVAQRGTAQTYVVRSGEADAGGLTDSNA